MDWLLLSCRDSLDPRPRGLHLRVAPAANDQCNKLARQTESCETRAPREGAV